MSVFKKILAFLLAVLAGLMTLPPGKIEAVQDLPSSSLGVSPAIIEEVLAPGEKKEATITLFNVTNAFLPVRGSVAGFVVNEAIPPEKRAAFDASSWVSLEPADLILPPNEHQEVKVVIAIPPEAEPGGHYATIYFQVLVSLGENLPQNLAVAPRVGVLALFSVKGEISRSLSPGKPKVGRLNRPGEINFALPVTNQGNVHLLPPAVLEISRPSGEEVASLAVPSRIILPGTTRTFSLSWPDSKLWGRFRAQSFWDLGSGEAIASPPVFFWVVPWPAIIAFLLLILGIIFFRRRLFLALRALFGSTP